MYCRTSLKAIFILIFFFLIFVGKDKLKGSSSSSELSKEDVEKIQSLKQQKEILEHGINMFNQKPKKGLDFLQKRGLVGRFSFYRFMAGGVFLSLLSQPFTNYIFILRFFCSRVGPDIIEFM